MELDEPVTQVTADVEVLIRSMPASDDGPREDALDFLRRLPDGTRTKADIDQQIREERDAWGDR